jgi:protein-disulfide isomerase
MRVALFGLVALLTSTAVLADDAALAERVRQLEATVESLSARVKALEAAPAGPARAQVPTQAKPWKLPIGNSPVLGPRDARYSLVIFAEMQCPFSARAHPLMQELLDDPELRDNINVVYKHFPLSFHKDARPAARIAIGIQKVAGDKAAWDFIELAYANQRGLDDEFFARAIKRLKLPRAAVLAAAENAEGELEAIAQLAQRVSVRGTPALFVNGWELKDRSVDGVKALIKERGL